MSLSKKARDGWSATGAVLSALASVWIIGVGFYLHIAFFVIAGFFFMICTVIGIMIYILRGTTWRSP